MMSKALQIPLDPNITKLTDIPYTISFIIKKRIQIDSLNELPKEKRPPDDILWTGTQEDLDNWLDRVFGRKQTDDELVLDLSRIKIEG